MFPNMVPMGRDTPSPEPLVHSLIHSCMSAGVPKKEPSYIRGKAIGHRPWSPMQMESLHTMGCSLVPQGDP
jgi:hypothetical protein